jgi:prefoldin beta subunit
MAENERGNNNNNTNLGKGVDFGKEEAQTQAQHIVMQIQVFQQQQQSLQAQRQQMELSIAEIDAALAALKETKEEMVYKAIGPVMVKKERRAVEADLAEMLETAHLRVSTMKKQEEKVKEKLKDLTGKLSGFIKAAGISGQ